MWKETEFGLFCISGQFLVLGIEGAFPRLESQKECEAVSPDT